MKVYKKIFFKIIFVAIVVLGLLLIYFYKFANPYIDTVDNYIDMKNYDSILTKSEAIEDLEYMYNKLLTRHVATTYEIPKKLKEQYNKEIESINSEITVLQLWQKSSRIISCLEDAHSTVDYIGTNDYEISGMFTYENDEIYYKESIESEEKLEVQSIDGIKSKELYNSFLSKFSYENLYWAKNRFASYLSKKSTLMWLGIRDEDTLKINCIDSDGSIISFSKKFEIIESDNYKSDSDYNFIKYKIVKENNLAVLSLYECNYNDEYIITLNSFFKEIEENDIDNIALDLRFNGGGNSLVINEFIRHISIYEYKDYGSKIRYGKFLINNNSNTIENDMYEGAFEGRVYLLTSNGTFSSAMMFASILKDNNIAKLIGEPPGNKPSSYGDILRFQMPNSKLALVTTYKQFTRPDSLKKEELALSVDYEVTYDMVFNKLFELLIAQ